MQVINANEGRVPHQAVKDAIALSIERSECVQLEASGPVLEGVRSEFDEACGGSDEGGADDPRAVSYWGEDVDGRRWRIRLLPIG